MDTAQESTVRRFLFSAFENASVADAWKMYEEMNAPPPYNTSYVLPSMTQVVLPVFPASHHTTIINNNNVVTTSMGTKGSKKEEDGEKEKKKKPKGFSAGELLGLAVLGSAITGTTYGLATLWKEASQTDAKLAVVRRARRCVVDCRSPRDTWMVTEVASDLFAVFNQVESSLKASKQRKGNWKIFLAGAVASSSCFFIDVLVNGGITRSFWGYTGIGIVLGTGITWVFHNVFGPTDPMASQREGIAQHSYNKITVLSTPVPSAPEEEQRSF